MKRQREALRGKVEGEHVDTNLALSKLAGCSRDMVRFVKTILKQGDADVIKKLRDGRLAVYGVYRRSRATLPM